MRASTVRKIALALPEAEERETWGTATFRVRNRIFTMFSEGERDAWVKSTADEQQALIAMYPKTFFFPPYVGSSGWIGVHIATVDRQEMIRARRGGVAPDGAEATGRGVRGRMPSTP